MNKQSEWDRDWLETMYNNLKRVKNSAQYLSSWKEQSQTIRTELTQQQRAILNIQYGTTQEQSLDLFLPDRQIFESFPVLIFIHGGYWHSLNKNDFSFIAQKFIEQGIAVVVPNYTLCPAVTVPDIVDEMIQAVLWVNNHIAQYGGEPDNITVSEHSAGGHLTSMMCATNWQNYSFCSAQRPFKNGLSMSGLFDLAPLQFTPFLQVLHLTEGQVNTASPIKLKPIKDCCLYTVVGGTESEEFHRQNQLIQNAWGKKMVPVCEQLPTLDHLTIVESLLDTQSRLYQLVIELVKQ